MPNEGVSLRLGATDPRHAHDHPSREQEFLYGTAFLSQSPEASSA